MWALLVAWMWVGSALLGGDGRAAGAVPVPVPASASADAAAAVQPSDDISVATPIDWPGYRSHADLIATPDGPRYRLTRTDGGSELITAEAFAGRSLESERGRSVVERVLNAHGWIGVAWVLFGLLGQVVFMGRMVVQWLVSERSKRSIVPPTFWFLSLVGSVMLLIYFVWRWDVVGILGQSLGSVIYVRNIMLIRHHRRVSEPDAEASPA